MAELNARIIAKASATAAEEPVAGDLEVAELAVNTADGKLFTKHTDGSIVTISGGGGGGAVDSVNGETGVVVLGLDDLDNTYIVETGERYYNEGTHPTGAETETGNYSIYDYVVGNRGLYLYRTDANGDDFEAMFPDGFTFGNGGTSGSLRISSTSGSGYTDYTFNYASNSASSSSMTPGVNWVKFNMDNRTIVPTGQGSLYFTTTVTVPSGGPTDGQALTWVDANSQWEPTSLAVDDLSDVSVATAPADSTLILKGEGASGGTVFTDSSSNALTPTATRNVTTETSIFKHGSSSIRFNNGGIDYADSATTKIGTTNGNFTIETWMYRLSSDLSSTMWIASKRVGITTDHSFGFWCTSSNISLRVSFDGTTLEDVTVAGADNFDQWYHVAAVREGTACRIYVDGVNVLNDPSAFSSSGPIFDTSAALCVGTYEAGQNGSYWYCDDLIITDGVAKYSANFTPGEVPEGPTDGQVLTWVDANSQWEPAAPASGGSGTPSPAIIYADVTSLGSDPSSKNLVLPSSIAIGDTIAIHLMVRGSAGDMPTIVTPGGYSEGPSLQRNDTGGTSRPNTSAIYYKTAVSGDSGATVTFDLSSPVDPNYFFTAAVWVVRGASYRIAYLDAWFAVGVSSGSSNLLNNTDYIEGDAIVGIAQLRPFSAYSTQIWRYDAAQGAALNHHYTEDVGGSGPSSSMVSTQGAIIRTGVASSTDAFTTSYANTDASPVYSVIRFAAS